MAESLANKDTAWLARFIQEMVGQSMPQQVAFQGADQVTVNNLLQVLDQIEISKQAFDYLGLGYDKWHVVGTTGEPAFQNGWTNYDITGTWQPARFRKFPGGLVSVQGLVKSGTLDTAIFTLPAGYRPNQALMMTGTNNAQIARLDVSAAGIINTIGALAGSNAFQSISQLWFLAEK
jgi:hypothetical protein